VTRAAGDGPCPKDMGWALPCIAVSVSYIATIVEGIGGE